MTSVCAVIIPVLHRPHRVEPLLESIDAATSERHRVLFMCTTGDEAEIAAVDAAGAEHLEVDFQPRGDYARKINLGYEATDEPLLFLAADDLRFHPCWLERAISRLLDGVGVVGTNDLGNPRVTAGHHATHSLVTRVYADEHGTIDEPHKILHEGYHHEYVDDELVGTAKRRGAWVFADDSFVEHLHPHWNKAPTDDLYDGQAARMRASADHFKQRRRLWM